MGDSTRASGSTIIWREWAFILGQMVESMRENIEMIRSMDLESILGLIRESTKDGGIKENSMV